MLGESGDCAQESRNLSSGFDECIVLKLDEYFMFQSSAGQECQNTVFEWAHHKRKMAYNLVIALKGCGVSIPGNIQDPLEHSLVQPTLTDLL